MKFHDTQFLLFVAISYLVGCIFVNLGHVAYQKDTRVYNELVECFGGPNILDERAEIDRRKLGAIVFSDPVSDCSLSFSHNRKLDNRSSLTI